jgi:hypothetical protein
MASQPPRGPAAQCMAALAARAGTEVRGVVLPAGPRDACFGWKAAAVHPLQPLETEYRGSVREAAEGEPNDELRRAIESEELSRYFLFDANQPRLLGPVADEEPPFPLASDDLRECRRALRAARRALAPSDPRQISRSRVVRHLEAALARARSLLQRFYALAGARSWRVEPVATADGALAGLSGALALAATAEDLRFIASRIATAADALDQALGGAASAQAFYVIQPFCLYRLLVRFRRESAREISAEAAADASGALTALLNNHHPWLSEWIRSCVVRIDEEVRGLDADGNVRFFLKGGRALEYLHNRPREGTGDWDVQVLINPMLPPEEWYRLFVRVNNRLIVLIEGFKLEFFMLLSHSAPRFLARMEELPARAGDPPENGRAYDAGEPGGGEAEEASDAKHRANCKAELIDVGLPRYDSVQAREQWALFNGGGCDILRGEDRVPYPGVLYFVLEYLMMIRGAFAPAASGLLKGPKRIMRLKGLLTERYAEEAIRPLREKAQALLPLSSEAVERHYAGEAHLPAKRALWAMLDQFIVAYGLDADEQLRQAFDWFVADHLGRAAELAPYPPALLLYIEQDRAWSPAAQALADAVGFAEWVSRKLEDHLAQRGRFVEDLPWLVRFVRHVGALFRQDEEWELQLAGAGAFAARQQADYESFAGIGRIEPLSTASIHLYPENPFASPAEMVDIVAPRIADCIIGWDLPLDWERAGEARLSLYFRDPLEFGSEAPRLRPYQPLVAELVARGGPARPRLSYVHGVPLLSPRELLVEARDRIALIEEPGRRRVLERSREAIIELMTARSHVPGPGPEPEPVPRDVTYLAVRSEGRALAGGTDYPPSYLPDRAFQVTLTANRSAARDRLLALFPGPATVDLLVLGGGHGGIGHFDTWSSDDLRTWFVEPLRARSVRAKVIVLDFCVSASLLPLMRELATPDGIVFSTLYSIPEVAVTTATWSLLQPSLERRDVRTMLQRLLARLRGMSRGFSGLSQLEKWRPLGNSDVPLAQHLALHPGDRDFISIVRYLSPIADLLAGGGNALPIVQARLVGNPLVGPGEQRIVEGLPAAGPISRIQREAVESRFKDRLKEILTEPKYEIIADIEGLPLLEGDDSLWTMVRHNWPHILSLAPGITSCPTPFSMWVEGSQQLSLDARLAALPLTQQTTDLISQVEPEAADDVETIVPMLLTSVPQAALNQVDNYLQE